MIKDLREKIYSMSNSFLPLDVFYNDIRDNPIENYDKERAYKDIEIIADFIIDLQQQLEEKDNLIEFGREEIRKRNKRIDEIVERDKKLFDDKNKELEELKQQLENLKSKLREANRVKDKYKFLEEKNKEKREKDDKLLKETMASNSKLNLENTVLKQQLAEKQNAIDEINKEFVQSIHDWKTLCAEKDKEIERLKTKQKPIVMHSKEDYFKRCKFLEEENIKLQFAQKQLAITELEKMKIQLYDKIKIMNNEEHCYSQRVISWFVFCDQIDNQINDLKNKN